MKKQRFHKYECLHCKEFKTYSLIKFCRHIKKEHNKTLSKKDFWFGIKWHFITQCFRYLLAYPLALIVLLCWAITYPIWWLHEFFDSFCN